eukprot:m.325417 g.325417  ORF g.325417 m.325417 type:complete len:76 (+) comp55559_c0_seq4:3703-3930(+)
MDPARSVYLLHYFLPCAAFDVSVVLWWSLSEGRLIVFMDTCPVVRAACSLLNLSVHLIRVFRCVQAAITRGRFTF